jgi:hypothetical protein
MAIKALNEICYSSFVLLTKDTVQSGRYLHTLRRNILPPASWSVHYFKVSRFLYQTTLQSS